jgi:hypothetical protein
LMLKGEVVDYELDRIPEPHKTNIEWWIKR